VILAFRRGSVEERQFWRRTLEDLEQRDDDLRRAQALIERYGALTETVERARHYGSLAKDALTMFPDGPERRALVEAAQFAIERAY
jgi:octaprenyl-diphosphate synthase